MKRRFDVLGLGCTAVDEILYIPSSPPADSKVEVRERERHCGGLTATALVAAARLGAKAAFAGTLGTDEGSQFVIATLRREKVNTTRVVRQTGAGPVSSVIVVDETRRTKKTSPTPTVRTLLPSLAAPICRNACRSLRPRPPSRQPATTNRPAYRLGPSSAVSLR